ncbi:MAG TPA: Ig-like domain-containing protein, partial [Isosphaeraceae bacterium]|nr:Ig-like domain-containing protein [Isosphaeraceae bacterium]
TSQPKDGTISQLDSTTGSLLYTPNQNFQGNDSFQFTVTDAGTGAPTTPNASKPATVTLTTTPGPLPVANPIVQSSTLGAPVSIQLSGNNESGSNQGIIYTITAQPTKGTISQLDATKGTLVYTLTTGASGTDTFQYIVTSTATGAHSLPATATINLQDPAVDTGLQDPAVDTGEVRQIGNVLVVTPLPRTDKGTNNILVTQLNDPTNAANDKIQVLINNQLDIHQPLVSDLESNGNGRIVVFGSKASDTITVDPSVDSGLAVTLDGGHGGHNTLKAGAGPTREHGWFGRNTLIGGAGPNELVGRAGRVKFRPSSTTDEIFVGVARPNFRNGHIRPPGGTFYKFVNGKLIPTTAARTGSA